MRRRLQRIVGIGVLMLAAGCATGAGLAADLPQTRPLPMVHSLDDVVVPPRPASQDDVLIPVLHPPDASIIAREPEPRWEKQLNATLVRGAPAPLVNWALVGFVVAFF
jgi:hypothetical protein